MTNKTAPINIMVEPNTKKKLIEKANALGLSLTAYVEKIGEEPIVFLDNNAKLILKALELR